MLYLNRIKKKYMMKILSMPFMYFWEQNVFRNCTILFFFIISSKVIRVRQVSCLLGKIKFSCFGQDDNDLWKYVP